MSYRNKLSINEYVKICNSNCVIKLLFNEKYMKYF